MWECRNCGHICVGVKAPEVCPVCNHPQSYFEVHAGKLLSKLYERLLGSKLGGRFCVALYSAFGFFHKPNAERLA